LLQQLCLQFLLGIIFVGIATQHVTHEWNRKRVGRQGRHSLTTSAMAPY
jgi:hypothetical protein